MSTIDKNFIVRQGLEVVENLIFADGHINRVGINTKEPLYDLQVSCNYKYPRIKNSFLWKPSCRVN
jgi:hypothetical protein